jgi:aspartate aminotransferase
LHAIKGKSGMTNQLTLSQRFHKLKSSATVEMTEKVRQLRSSGKEVIGLSSGDPNVPAHPAIIEALNRALRQGETTYGPSQGKVGLRRALSVYLTQRSGAEYSPKEIIITPGGKFAVYAAIMAIIDPGDEVIVLEPCWVSYGPCISLAGGITIGINCLKSLDYNALERAINSRTKAIIVNTPVNPTGRLLSLEELEIIAVLARENNLWVISDEVYSELIYEPHRHFSIASLDEMKERTFLVDSFSKTFGMTGWRVGSMALPADYVKNVLKIVQHSVYCVPPFIQTAAEEALHLYPDIIMDIRESFHQRVEYASQKLNSLPGFACCSPEATYYLFPSVPGDDKKISMQWLDNLNIAVLPGSSFGGSGKGHIRFSITCSMHLLRKAMSLLERYYYQED